MPSTRPRPVLHTAVNNLRLLNGQLRMSHGYQLVGDLRHVLPILLDIPWKSRKKLIFSQNTGGSAHLSHPMGEEKREICTVAQSTRPPDKALAPTFHLFLSEMKLSFREQRVPRDAVAVPHGPLHPRRFPLRPQERLPWRGG